MLKYMPITLLFLTTEAVGLSTIWSDRYPYDDQQILGYALLSASARNRQTQTLEVYLSTETTHPG